MERTHFWLGPMLLLAACESEADIAAEMERALADSSQAMVGILLSTEVMHQVSVPPAATVRHGPDECGCPCTDRVGAGASFVMTLDYADLGCVPVSQLLPTSLAGHAVLEFDGSECGITWDQLVLGLEHAVSGDVTGPASGSSVSPRGKLTIGPWTGTLDVDVAMEDDALFIDGEVTSKQPDDDEPRTVRFDGVRLPRAAILGQCPTPDDGEATLLHPKNDQKNAVVRFAHPGDGQVTVVRDERVSAATDWCGYTSPLW
jgi:hypothetical protein